MHHCTGDAGSDDLTAEDVTTVASATDEGQLLVDAHPRGGNDVGLDHWRVPRQRRSKGAQVPGVVSEHRSGSDFKHRLAGEQQPVDVVRRNQSKVRSGEPFERVELEPAGRSGVARSAMTVTRAPQS